jgi:hypothetical protein
MFLQTILIVLGNSIYLQFYVFLSGSPYMHTHMAREQFGQNDT